MAQFLTILFLIPVLTYGQILTKKDIAPLCLTFASGLFDGGAESLKFHYAEVDRKLSLNDKFWNPSVSWKNKYKNGDPAQGEKFRGSTTTFVWATDGYHAMRFGRNACIMTGIALKIGERQRWYEYLIEMVAYYLSYQAGFTLSYELLKL